MMEPQGIMECVHWLQGSPRAGLMQLEEQEVFEKLSEVCSTGGLDGTLAGGPLH